MFDAGVKAKELRKGTKLRRQIGTIIYDHDKVGAKGPRNVNVYLPMIDPAIKSTEDYCSWPDDEKRKSNVNFEYHEQK